MKGYGEEILRILSILAVVEFRKYWDSHIFQCLFDTCHCLYYTELAFISVKQVIGCQRMKLYRIKEKTNRFLCESLDKTVSLEA